MENKYNLIGVLKTLFKRKKEILYICVIAAVGSIIISLLLPVYYESTTIFLVSSPERSTPESLYPDGSIKTYIYGGESDIDRTLTIAESNQLVSFVVDSFKLYEHYKINPKNPKAPYKVRQKFADHFSVTKTKRDAIELTLEDRDREFAAKVVNAVREKIDQLSKGLVKETQYEEIVTIESDINSREKQLTILADTLSGLRARYRIFNIVAQSEKLTSQFSDAEATLAFNEAKLEALKTTPRVKRDSILMAEVKVKSIEKEVTKLEEKLRQFNDGLPSIAVYEKMYIEANQRLTEDRERLKKVLAAYNSDIPTILLVEEGSVPVIKSRPRRSIIVLASIAVAFLFSLIGVLLYENYKDINWKEIYNAK